MKALFIAAGRRVTMCENFNFSGFNVDSYELDLNCPINLVANKVLPGKKWKDKNLVTDLTKYISSGEYSVVIPFQDSATQILSSLKHIDKSDILCVSPKKITDVCLDKALFEKFFLNNEKICKYYPKDVGEEVVLKPKCGYGSKNIKFIPKCPEEIDKNYIAQRRIYGTEYSVDCYFDKNSNLIDYVPRVREQVTNGEVTRSTTVSKLNFAGSLAVKEIASELHFVGPICMQFIVDEKNNPWIIEINARFGGGSTLSLAAGFNIIGLIKQEYFYKKNIIHYNSSWKSDYKLARCYRDYYYES